MSEHDVLNNIHDGFGKMEPLEKEIYESYKKAVEDGTLVAMYNYQEEWRKRPEDLDKLVQSKNSAIRIYVAEVGQGKYLGKLVNDPDEWVLNNKYVRAYQELQDWGVSETELQVLELNNVIED